MNIQFNWTLVVIVMMMIGVFLLQGCGTRGDGMNDLWVGVQHMEKNR